MLRAGRPNTQARAERWNRLVVVACQGYGYLTVDRLHRLGFDRHRIDHLAATGLLDSVSYGLYRLPGSPADWKSKLYQLTVETRSCASHLSAALLLGLGSPKDLSPGYAEATSHHRSRRSPEFAFRLYRDPSLDAVEQIIIDAIPCLPIDRTLLDVAREHGVELFTACFNEAVRRRLIDFADLVDSFERDSRRKGAPAIRAALESVEGEAVAMSDWSNWAADRLVSAGLPEPDLEAVLHDTGGRRIAQVDLYWGSHRVVVELDGREYYFDSRAFAGDRRRDALLAGLGITVIRVTWEQYNDGSYFVDVVRNALAQREVDR
ncbi:MAG: endonuclease domain-containing protein [Acidimicrobiales bacterium]